MKKTVVITGASSGIGRETAQLFAKHGDTIYDLSRSDKPLDGVTHIYCDVTKPQSIAEAFQTIGKSHSHIDILILCAGMGIAGSIEHTSEEEMRRQFDVNTFGPIRVLQCALPLMRQGEATLGERGRVVFVSSMAAVFGIPFQAMYSATKAAVNSFAFALRNELHSQRISVTVVMPGDVKTNFKRSTNLIGSDIYPQMSKAISQMEHDEASGLSAISVAHKVYRAATRKRPSLFYTSDLTSDLECLLQRMLPTSVALYVVKKLYHC